MPIEIEKKFRLTPEQRNVVLGRLPGIGATRVGEEFEENTLYAGGGLDIGRSVLRLRRVAEHGTLTYKEKLPTASDIKHQREEETLVSDPNAAAAILEAIGFRQALVYEKRRETWRLGTTEIVVDELPFGLFMEIEGDESAIRDIETRLAIKDLESVITSYPQLTRTNGVVRDGVIEARFVSEK